MSIADTSGTDSAVVRAAGDDTSGHGSSRNKAGRSRLGLVAAIVVVGVLGLVVGRWLVGAMSPHLYAGTVLQSDEPAPSMELLSFADTGQPVDVGAEAGKVVLVFFGYTSCPDVCPATMSTVTGALDRLDADQKSMVEVWMVTVDPERDQPESLQQYVEFFNPEFRGVSGPVDVIDQVASQYGVFYQLGPEAAEGSDDYLVDHTASLFGIGPDGALRVIWAPTTTAEQLSADLDDLL